MTEFTREQLEEALDYFQENTRRKEKKLRTGGKKH